MDTRAAIESDEAPLFEIHRTVFRGHIEDIWGWDESWQQGNFAAELRSSDTTVLEISDRIVGYVQTRTEASRIYLQNIALLPEFQGMGIGTQLLRDLMRIAGAQNKPLELAVFRTNKDAQRFYEGLGFQSIRSTSERIEMNWQRDPTNSSSRRAKTHAADE